MKIGIFTDAYVPQIGGVSTASQLIKKYASKLGHEVYVITTTDHNAKEEANVIRFPSLPFVSEKRIGIGLSPVSRKQVKDLNLDIIHTQTEYSIGAVGKQLSQQQNIPLVHTFHTLYEDWMIGQLGDNLISRSICVAMNALLKVHLQAAKTIIVPSQKTIDYLESFDLNIPMRILPTGIELNKFYNAGQDLDMQTRLRKRLGLDKNTFVLVYVGRISEEKEIDVILRYLEPVIRNKDNLAFIVVGSGPKLEDYRGWVNDKNLNNKIHFIGQVPVDEVQNYYAIGDVFCCASRSETQGLTYIEAMATGLTTLVVQDPCLDGVVDNEVNGLFFNSKTDFANKLTKLMDDEEYRLRLARAAKELSQEFSVERFIEELIEIYESVL